ncbi:hypothetical protein [Pedobacter cryophilus]|uniref:Uncharacterized protein n=1 Tax=Pedobacter cryophilus TaxID=2571271 RepID=A0A4U1BWY9_9SPHI|nr:hypothetical protein [Pedobacter cryophilus]TKB96864.1 hypothetical protein FA046_12360 [Pedobacter cryophilus]
MNSNKPQKRQAETKTPPIGNVLNCADLLSAQFSDCLQKMFDELGKTVFDKRIVRKIIRAYYVMVDLKGGIPLNKITQDRLNVFHSVVWGYMLNNDEDETTKKLWQVVDDALYEICT